MKTFSIILPVRNGGEYVKECVNSILNQTTKDFDLIVLDNCSTDGTLQWLQSLNDGRVIIYPSEAPLSIEENWARILSVPKNEYITLIGHDDILTPSYLKTTGELIDKYPEATLYQTHFSFIDSTGIVIKHCRPMKEKEDGPAFLRSILQNKIDVIGTGFMMRSKDYDLLGGIPSSYPNLLFADFQLWLNLADKSYKVTSVDEAFYFRLHQSTTSISSNIKYQAAFEKFVFFLAELKKRNTTYSNIIADHTAQFVLFYCISLSHRLLKTPKNLRAGLTISQVIKKCNEYNRLLGLNNEINYLSDLSILAARIIDSNTISRTIFLLLKNRRVKK